MDDALRALASPTRRTILTLVWDRERSSGDIAERAELSKPAASQHLRVLRDTGLVDVRVDGQRRWYRARPDRVAEVRADLEAFWGARLSKLAASAEAMTPAPIDRKRRRR